MSKELALRYIDTLQVEKLQRKFSPDTLRYLFTRVPAHANLDNLRWWTPCAISATNYGRGREGQMYMLVLPAVVLNILVCAQYVENIQPHPVYDDESFFPQYFFNQSPHAFLHIPSELEDAMITEYFGRIGHLIDSTMAMNYRLEISKEKGSEFFFTQSLSGSSSPLAIPTAL